MEKVFSFSEYTNENLYKIGADGTFQKQDWSYYKDHHPANYDVAYEADGGCTWVIKFKEDKVALITGTTSEDDVKKIMQLLAK